MEQNTQELSSQRTLCNDLNSRGFALGNQGYLLNRCDFINNYFKK